MTANLSIDPDVFLHEQLAQASPDLMRDLLSTFVNALLSAQADSVCGADYGTRSTERTNRRNGYRHRDLDTRTGTLDIAIPKLREGSFFPEWLLERHRRAEAALTTVVATCYLLGVSTRRMDKLVRTLGITGLSKSKVSEMAKDLDAQVEAFRTRPLDEGPYTFVAADALTMKVRENGRVVKVAVMVATGVNADDYREILGIQCATTESGAGWLGFFRDLVARGLTKEGPVGLVTSDAHTGLVEAIGATLPAASWQRCRTHYAANLMDRVEIGKRFRVDNIYYDYNKATLRADALPNLDKVQHILTDNPQLIVELGSHADSRGSDAYNLSLSQKRAESAVGYIISTSITPARISAKGYGESRLLNHCGNGVKCPDAEHEANRRTEFTIIDIDETAIEY